MKCLLFKIHHAGQIVPLLGQFWPVDHMFDIPALDTTKQHQVQDDTFTLILTTLFL